MNETQMQREEDYLYECHGRGELTHRQLQHELRELQRDAQAALAEEAQAAYDDVMYQGW